LLPVVSTSARELVGKRHQKRAANARLDVLLGDVFPSCRERRAPAPGELGKERTDRNGFKTDAEVRGQLWLSSMEPRKNRDWGMPTQITFSRPSQGLG